MNYMYTRRVLLAGIGVCVGLFILAWFWVARSIFFRSTDMTIPTQNISSVHVPSSTKDVENITVPVGESSAYAPPEMKTFTEFSKDDIRKGQVTWQEPQDMGDLGWTSHDVYTGKYQSKNGYAYSGGVKYLKVGTVKEGMYTGSEVIVVFSWLYTGDFPRGESPDIQHYLRKDGKVTLLTHAATANGVEVPLPTSDVKADDSSQDDDAKALILKASNEVVDNETRIEDLALYPTEFQGRNSRETFVNNGYADRAVFSSKGLKLAFESLEFGQVWMTDTSFKGEIRTELNSYQGRVYDSKPDKDGKDTFKRVKKYYDPVVSGGFYLKRPDGIMEAYRLKFDIFDIFDRQGVLQATWNDGSKNTTSYEEYPGGCGMTEYVYDKTNSVSIKKDLVIIGKTEQGDLLYGYRESNSALKKYFDETYLPSLGRQSSADLGMDRNQLWKEFLQKRPIVLWQDSFGRLLAFYNTDTIPLAECGKPVVYLYPEKSADVSVRVFPSEGVSVSDPAYNDGWDVVAQPDGTLMNKMDGKNYPYLFWEGGSDTLYQTPEQGFVAAKEDLSVFFDEKLSQLGLSAKESSDFKEFWIPKMTEKSKPYYFITFLSRAQIDRLAPLAINPKPDTIIRVMMDYEGLDSWKAVPGYAIKTPKREGFTAVEWGGRMK